MSPRRYWVEFDVPPDSWDAIGLTPGCGVTADDRADAVTLIGDALGQESLPAIKRIIEDVDVSTLDAEHVLPNLGDPSRRGVWYPPLQASR